MEKRKPRLTALLIAVLVLLGLAGAFLLGTRFPAPKRSGDARLRYAAGRVLCIGDSLTSGTCFGSGLGGADTEQRYAYYLGRMLSAEVDGAAVPGYSASDWYPRFADELDFSAYDTVTVWLGTNNGPLDTLSEDVLPYTDPADYAPTETGWYCRILEKIRAENPDCLILLLNVYASKDEAEEVNRAIATIAARYGLPVADMSDLGAPEHPELHAGLEQNPHLGKTGNIVVASRICDALEAWFLADPARCEYGVRSLHDNA